MFEIPAEELMALEFGDMLKVMEHFACFVQSPGGARAADDMRGRAPSRGARGPASSSTPPSSLGKTGGRGAENAEEGQGNGPAAAAPSAEKRGAALAAPPQPSFAAAPAAAKPVDMVIKLGLDYSAAGKEGTAHRAAFVNNLAQDLANATGQPPDAFEVTRVSPGSVLVDMLIHDGAAGGGEPRATPMDVACDLERQARDPASPLRAGVLTRHTQAIALPTIRPGSMDELLPAPAASAASKLPSSRPASSSAASPPARPPPASDAFKSAVTPVVSAPAPLSPRPAPAPSRPAPLSPRPAPFLARRLCFASALASPTCTDAPSRCGGEGRRGCWLCERVTVRRGGVADGEKRAG